MIRKRCDVCDTPEQFIKETMGLLFCESCGANKPVPTKESEYVLYGYATPSGKLYASSLEALQNCEQSWVKVYVNKEDLK